MHCCAALAATPGRSAGSFNPPLFGLAPSGVYQASASRRNWWSLTPPFQLSCPSLSRVFFSVALSLSRHAGQLPLATTLPYGARTFLPELLLARSDHTTRSIHVITATIHFQAKRYLHFTSYAYTHKEGHFCTSRQHAHPYKPILSHHNERSLEHPVHR